jgi:hypothetical protein
MDITNAFNNEGKLIQKAEQLKNMIIMRKYRLKLFLKVNIYVLNSSY